MSKQAFDTDQPYGLLHPDIEGIDFLAELALDIRWSWSHAADDLWQQLEHFTNTKEKGMGKDQQQPETSLWKQALASPALEQQTSERTNSDAVKSSFGQDFSHLSTEQQERYTALQAKMLTAEPGQTQEMER